MTIRVLLADDHAAIRMGLAMILDGAEGIEVVAEASDGAAAVRRARALRPDVVLMDVRMPGMDGIEATRELVSADICQVLVLTTFDLDEYVYEALRAGASGFLLKDSPPAELTGGVRTIARGEALLAPAITRNLIGHFADRVRPADPAESARDAVLRTLTRRELEVFELVAAGLSNAEIAADLFIGSETVKTYVSRILSKLDLRDRVQAVVLAYRVGLASGLE
ncbi:MAG: response regulator [Stackebrandtia sp.]